MKRTYLILLLLLGFRPLFAQTGGNSTYTFLRLTNSARVAALGGDNISINDNDLNFVYHNPALLNSEMANNLVLNYINYFAGINFGYAAYAHDFNKVGTMAAGLHYVDYGSFTAANEKGEITGSFRAYEMALNIFWSKPILDSMFTVGANLKPIYSQLESYNSFGLALDVGANYVSESGLFSASAVFKNIGSQIDPYYEGHYESLPFDFQLGLTQRLAHAPFRVSMLLHHLHRWDLTYDKNANLAPTAETDEESFDEPYDFNFTDNIFRHANFSLEFIPSENFIVMAGYNHQRRKELMVPERPFLVGFSWGFYIKVSKLRLSFGQAIYHLAGSSKHFSLNLNLGDFYKKGN